jgi:hypothetical protein
MNGTSTQPVYRWIGLNTAIIQVNRPQHNRILQRRGSRPSGPSGAAWQPSYKLVVDHSTNTKSKFL